MKTTERIKNFLWRFRWIRELALRPNPDNGINELIRIREFNSNCELFSAYAVFIGLAIETIILFAVPNKPALEAVPNAIVALGVWGEIHFGYIANLSADFLLKNSDERIAESERLTAEANQKADEARLAHERLKAQISWRFIAPETVAKLLFALKEKPVGNLAVAYIRDDPECVEYALNFVKIFREANWEVGTIATRPFNSVDFLFIPEIAVFDIRSTIKNQIGFESTSILKEVLTFAGFEFGISQGRGIGGHIIVEPDSFHNNENERASLTIGKKTMPRITQ